MGVFFFIKNYTSVFLFSNKKKKNTAHLQTPPQDARTAQMQVKQLRFTGKSVITSQHLFAFFLNRIILHIFIQNHLTFIQI